MVHCFRVLNAKRLIYHAKKMVRNYSTDNATLSFMQTKQSSGIFSFEKIEKYKYNYNIELIFLCCSTRQNKIIYKKL